MSIILPLFLLFICIYAQIDACSNINCPPGFRCSQGICLKQKYAPKKQICSANKNIVPIKCTNRKYQCIKISNTPSCGYTSKGILKDFDNDCLPCLDQSIQYYVRQSCSNAPQICTEKQECVNGKCLQMFEQTQFKDYVSCSKTSDCKPVIELCVAGKCVKIMQTVNQLNKKLPK